MFKVSDEHWKAFTRAVFLDREESFLPILKAAFPVEWERHHEEGIRARIRAGIDIAVEHGIDDGADVMQILQMTVALGPGFAAEPWAAEILKDEKWPASTRVRQLVWMFEERQARAEGA